MSNYTKTTDFEAKDSLPTGDSEKIIRGSEFETEFDAISTAIGTKADTAGPTFTGTLTFETISDGSINVTAFVDEDNMASNSATLVPTQQSVKAYVDSVTTELQAQDLDFQADSGGALNIDLDTETMTFTGGTGIDTTGSGNAVTFDIDSTVTTLTGTQTLTNKTLTAPVISGNLTTDGTIDGRDVATDGAKLDGIEAGATADQTAAEIRTLVESATDSNVFTDADHSKLDGIEASATADQTDAEIRAAVEAATDSNVFTDADHTKLNGIEASADVTDTANVTAAGALMDSELTSEASVKALNQGVATTDSPTFAAVTVNGNVEFDGLSGTGAVTVTDILDQDDMSSNSATALATQQSIKAYVDTTVAATNELVEDTTPQLGGDLDTNGNDITFGDNDKAIFGAGSDLQIYHDGSNSFIADVGTGNLGIRAENLFLQNADGSANYATASLNGAFTLSYNNSIKLATTSTGIDVTGTVTADGLTVDGDATISDTTPSLLLMESDTTDVNTRFLNNGGDFFLSTINDAKSSVTNRFSLDHATGDIRFYEDTGTTAKLFWDASAESLGIGQGVFSGTQALNLKGEGIAIKNDKSGSNNNWSLIRNTGTASTSNISFVTGAAEALVLAHDTNVGIGTDSPNSYSNLKTLTINGTNGSVVDFETNGTISGEIFSESNSLKIDAVGSSGVLKLLTNSTERMRIDSSGMLGLGSTPPTDAHATWSQFFIGEKGSVFSEKLGSGGIYGLWLTDNNYIDADTGNHAYRTTDEASAINLEAGNTIFYRAASGTAGAALTWSESMRIDTSGNLLVGTTDSAPAVSNSEVGVALSGSLGYVAASRSAGASGFFNRLSDGDIVNFNKDGSTVGSIGTAGGDLTINGQGGIGVLQAGGTGQFAWASNLFYPITDNAKDLGTSSFRFKDLYLSGGVVFGTTGGNVTGATLDDYEEGTWTPVLVGSTTAGTATFVTGPIGTYTKIGNQVTVYFDWNISAHTGTGALRITGLPFALGSGVGVGAIMDGNYTYSAGRTKLVPYVVSSSILRIYQTGDGLGYTENVLDTAHQINGSVTYQTA